MPDGIKIARFLAEAGVGSRRYCETLVVDGKVRVNGRMMDNVAERVDPDIDIIELSGRRLRLAGKAVFALNKPPGYVSTMSDPHASRTIADLIPAKLAYLGLKPVGRLDKESEGLMLLTNDGDLANRLMHPRHGISKIYRVSLDKSPKQRVLDILRKGVTLPEGERLRGMGIRIAGSGPEAARELELTLKEGKKREIRKGFEMFGHRVRKLQRIAIGPIRIGVIRRGELVRLKENQVKKLREYCGM